MSSIITWIRNLFSSNKVNYKVDGTIVIKPEEIHELAFENNLILFDYGFSKKYNRQIVLAMAIEGEIKV